MSDFNNKLVIELFKQRDALKADVVRLTLKVAELYKGAEEQKRRIKRLEEAGDKMASAWDKEWLTEADIEAIIDDWHGAKEAKP